MDEGNHTTVRTEGTKMRATYAWLQRCWRGLVDKGKGCRPRLQVPGLFVSVLISLGLLALGVSWSSQRPMPQPALQQAVPSQPTSTALVPGDRAASAPGGKAYLGIRGKTFHWGEMRGIKVLEVFLGSPAARAGLRSDRTSARGTGHIIVGVDGQPARSEEELGQILARRSPGDQVQLFVTNTVDKASAVIPVTLGAAPQVSPSAERAAERATQGSRRTEATVQEGPQSQPAADVQSWPKSAGPEPELAPPARFPAGLQGARRMSEPLAQTQSGVTPVSWSGRLIPLLMKMVDSRSTERNSESAEVPSDLIDAYIDRLGIMPVQRTRLVKITFSTRDPELAARVANAHAVAYLQQGIELRSRANEEALHFLEEKLTELKERVEKSEAALNRYRRDRGIISLDNRENIVVDRLADLNKRLTEAEADRITLEAQARLMRKNEYDALPAVIDNRLIQTLKGELARLEGDYAELATKFKPGYPALDQLQAKVEQTKRRLQQEIQRTVGGIKSAYAAAKQKEDELRGKMEQQKTAALGLKDAAVEYAILAREVDTNRQLYDSVLQRLKEMQVAAALRASNVSVIDQAVSPLQPSRPNKRLSLLLSAVVGLIGGVGLAFCTEHFSNTLKTPQEVERYLRLPNLSIVPDFVRLARHNTPPSESTSSGVEFLDGATAQAGFVLAHDPFSVTTEAYRTLRAAILLAQADTSPHTLLFTSGVHGEGKTVTVVNTAAVLAQMGVRVLVIDADLRCASCHKVLGLENDAGLADVLTGQRELTEVIHATAIEQLFFLSSGPLPLNPAELVGSKKMRDTLAALQGQYDYILIDSPPVMPVSDAVLLAAMADGVVLVANAQQTPKQVVRATRTRLHYAHAKILGVVLNRLHIRHGDYAYYYHQDKSVA